MKQASLISVIVPTCFREQLLIDCVDSLVSQSYPSFEIIVIDQAPQPRLEAVLGERFHGDPRIRYFHVDAAGAARARNTGVAHAAGSIVAFIDDDAVAETAWLQEVAEALEDPLHPAVVAGRLLPLWNGRRPPWYPRQAEYLLGLYDIGDRRCPMPPADLPIGANMAGLRSIIIENGGFDENLGPNYFRKNQRITGEDGILGQRIRAAGHVILYEPGAVVRHRVDAHKQTRSYFITRNFWEGVTVIQQMQLLGVAGSSRWPHYRFHGREICMAIARWILPTYRHNYTASNSVVRMLALGRVAYSLGVMYGLGIAPPDSANSSSQCASA
jgi:glycosyltransferase involved in cell wall biosynthesis